MRRGPRPVPVVLVAGGVVFECGGPVAKLSFLIQPAACREAVLQCAERALGTWHVCVRAAAREYECLIALARKACVHTGHMAT